jgi:hypothetical protein
MHWLALMTSLPKLVSAVDRKRDGGVGYCGEIETELIVTVTVIVAIYGP